MVKTRNVQKLKQDIEKILECCLVYTLGNLFMLDLFSILYAISKLDPGNDYLEDKGYESN